MGLPILQSSLCVQGWSRILYCLSCNSQRLFFLTGPERRDWAYYFAFLWGIGYCLMYPAQRVLFCTLTPRKQETELMGLFVFLGQILGWLPPVVYTVMNK
jgi:MFS-type transporter involved in bile tolerance (Atg22 family)